MRDARFGAIKDVNNPLPSAAASAAAYPPASAAASAAGYPPASAAASRTPAKLSVKPPSNIRMMTKQVGIRNPEAQLELQLLQSQIKWQSVYKQFYVDPGKILYTYPRFRQCCKFQFVEAIRLLKDQYRNLRESDINDITEWFQYTVGACASEWYDVLSKQDIYIGRDAKIQNEVKLLDWENLRMIQQDPEVPRISDTYHHANILAYTLQQPQINRTAQATAQVYRPLVVIPVLSDPRRREVSSAIRVLTRMDQMRFAKRFVIVQYSLQGFNDIVNQKISFAKFYALQELKRKRREQRLRQRQQAREAGRRRKPPHNRGPPQQSMIQTSPGYSNRFAAPEFTQQQRTQPRAGRRRVVVPKRRPRPPPGPPPRKPPPPPGPPPGRRRQLQGPPPGPFTNYQELVRKMFDLRF